MPLIKERIKYLNECLQDTEEGTDEYNDIYDEPEVLDEPENSDYMEIKSS